jgi:hypothetical protein
MDDLSAMAAEIEANFGDNASVHSSFGAASTTDGSGSTASSASSRRSGGGRGRKRRERSQSRSRSRSPMGFGPRFRDNRRRAAAQDAAAAARAQERGHIPMDNPGGEEREKINGDWRFQSFDKEDWSDIVDHPDADPNYCFFCECSQTQKQQKGFPNYRKYEEWFYGDYEKMSRKAVAKMGVVAFNQYLRLHSDSQQHMTHATLLQHFEFHAPNRRISLIMEMRTLIESRHKLSGKILEVDQASKDERLHSGNLNQYMKLSEKIDVLMEKITKLKPV